MVGYAYVGFFWSPVNNDFDSSLELVTFAKFYSKRSSKMYSLSTSSNFNESSFNIPLSLVLLSINVKSIFSLLWYPTGLYTCPTSKVAWSNNLENIITQEPSTCSSGDMTFLSSSLMLVNLVNGSNVKATLSWTPSSTCFFET